LAGAKLSSEGGIVQCSVIGWRDDACRLRKAVPKCPGAEVSRHRTDSYRLHNQQLYLQPVSSWNLFISSSCSWIDAFDPISIQYKNLLFLQHNTLVVVDVITIINQWNDSHRWPGCHRPFILDRMPVGVMG